MNDKPLIEISHFQRAGINNASIVEFLELYLSEMLTIPDKFEKCIATNDYFGAEQLLHSFKGASEVVGAYRVSALTSQLESLVKLDEPIASDFLIEQFRLGINETQVGINQAIHALRPIN